MVTISSKKKIYAQSLCPISLQLALKIHNLIQEYAVSKGCCWKLHEWWYKLFTEDINLNILYYITKIRMFFPPLSLSLAKCL